MSDNAETSLPLDQERDHDAASAAGQAERRGRRLFAIGVAGLLGLIGYNVLNHDTEDVLHLYLGVAIIVLATAPALIWARDARFHLPVFEVFMLTAINTYALPLLNGHTQLRFYDPEVITHAALTVVVFQAAAVATFFFVRGGPRFTPFWTRELLGDDAVRFLRYGVLLSAAYQYVSSYTTWIPWNFAGPLRAVFFGAGIVSTFVLARLWGAGRLSPGNRALFIAALAAQAYLALPGLVMIATLSQIVLALLGYVSSSRRLPLAVLLPLLAVTAVLHNGKASMRERYWERDQSRSVPVTALPDFYAEWFEAGFGRGEDNPALAAKFVDRASLFHILCLVVSRTPEKQPYLDGLTYSFIPGQFVPRFLWPAKPVGHIATHTIGIYYGLIDEESTQHTTIAIGLLAEAFANFGTAGAIVLGIVMAAALRKVTLWAHHSPMFSGGGLLMVVLMAWSFQTELTLSIWLTSMFQAAIAVVVAPLLLHRFLS
ncbi:MAG TPA: hypothetical protein VGD81_20760 [Opitutaceae bacterium]